MPGTVAVNNQNNSTRRRNPVGKRMNHLKGSVEVKKSVVPTLLLRRGRKKEGRGSEKAKEQDIVA